MRARRVALFGLLVALALVLSYAESLVPLSFAAPGVKLGLPNVAVLFALYRLGWRRAAVVSLLRVVLVSFLFGNAYSLMYSAAGAALSIMVMGLLWRTGRFGVTGVSVAGGIAHNIGQIAVAVCVLETGRLMFYLPVLVASGLGAGIGVGLLSAALIRRVRYPKGDAQR